MGTNAKVKRNTSYCFIQFFAYVAKMEENYVFGWIRLLKLVATRAETKTGVSLRIASICEINPPC